MSSVVQICNMALSHIGDSGSITSIDPPDGSTQAARCATYYPHARDMVLEAHTWSFNTVRGSLALSGDAAGPWAYRYAMPSNALRVAKVLPSASTSAEDSEPFITEADATGNETILTDTEDATALYVISITDTSKFSPSFEDALSWLLASFLAGPIIKGAQGTKFGSYCFERYVKSMMAATASNASQHKPQPSRTPSSISSRA